MNKEVMRVDGRQRARPVQSRWVVHDHSLETPRWNVHKYLIGRDGHIARGFAGDIEPMDARVVDSIMKELPPLE
jgi:glutathione peroxidase-family protein